MRAITLIGKAPEMTQRFVPELDLSDASYEIALASLHTKNTVSNVRAGCNILHLSDGTDAEFSITLPTGTHTVEDIHHYIYNTLRVKFKEEFESGKHFFEIHADPVTHACHISTSFDLHFSRPDSVGPLLGYTNSVKRSSSLAKELVKSNSPVTITDDFHVYITCNIAEGCLINNRKSHVIHEINMGMMGPSAVVIEKPAQPVFHAVSHRKTNDITIRLEDAQGRLVPMKDDTTLQCTLLLRTKNEEYGSL